TNVFTITFGGSLQLDNQDQITSSATSGVTATLVTLRDGPEGTDVSAGATLQLLDNITVPREALVLRGTGLGGIGALDNLQDNNEWQRSIRLATDVAIGSEAGTLTVSGVITDNGGDFEVTKVGAGTLRYTAANTYTDITTVNTGTLLLDNATGQSLAGNLT